MIWQADASLRQRSASRRLLRDETGRWRTGRITRGVSDWLSGRCFRLVHQHNLVYNTCWEDPRLDRAALQLSGDDTLVMITSAGCNALDYALEEPQRIDAVDLNPRQNALLELKIAGIRALDFASFFAMFGEGRLTDCRRVYERQLRPQLSVESRGYWDRNIDFFGGEGLRRTFYFHGTTGTFAWLINQYIDRVARLREDLNELFSSSSVEEQRAIFEGRLRDAFWHPLVRWLMRRDTTLSMLGVPRPQRRQVELAFEGGIGRFVEQAIENVFTRLPVKDNYFWRVYLTGSYTPECCPEYLRRENFERLKGGLVERIHVHTMSVTEFLRGYEGRVSRFVLLDHMDWLATHGQGHLADEWQAIVDRAAPEARVLWRSGGVETEFVNETRVRLGRDSYRVGGLLRYDRELAAELHALDRVHTYGSFHIADLTVA